MSRDAGPDETEPDRGVPGATAADGPASDRPPLSELLRRLDASADGLTQDEAGRRLERFGYNELAEKKVNPLLKFLSYFWGPIPWMIEAAAVLSAVVRHWEDFFIILARLVMNVIRHS